MRRYCLMQTHTPRGILCTAATALQRAQKLASIAAPSHLENNINLVIIGVCVCVGGGEASEKSVRDYFHLHACVCLRSKAWLVPRCSAERCLGAFCRPR